MKANVTIMVDKRKSAKTAREYVCAYVDMGYAQKIISVNAADIAEILGISVAELYDHLKS